MSREMAGGLPGSASAAAALRSAAVAVAAADSSGETGLANCSTYNKTCSTQHSTAQHSTAQHSTAQQPSTNTHVLPPSKQVIPTSEQYLCRASIAKISSLLSTKGFSQ
jgi:hypothetical protein